MRYYKKGEGVLATVGKLNLPEITREEYLAVLLRLKERGKLQALRGERTRPLTQEEVGKLLIAQTINTLEVDDMLALRMRSFYPQWERGQDYPEGHKVQFDGGLWRCLQAHQSQEGWTPDTAVSLWERINETYAGTKDDPIPYEGNMALVAGQYYIQQEVIYRCFRDTGIPVYHPLSQLVGLYVEVA